MAGETTDARGPLIARTSPRALFAELVGGALVEIGSRPSPMATAYLIELNPRFFGGLSQAIAAKVDYPHLLFRIASGETVEEMPEVDYTARTEAPVVGLLATLDEIAHDDRLLDRFRKVRDELVALGRSDIRDVRLRPLWEAIKAAANPKDIRAYLREMFEKHRGAINDVMQSDDPAPALGVLFPITMMLKHGKLSMSVLTAEEELAEQRPRRRFRDLLRRPRWRTLVLTAVLFAVSVFTVSAEATRNNLGLIFGWPLRVAEALFGPLAQIDTGTIGGALQLTAYHALNFVFLYVVAALILRQRKKKQ